MFDLLLIYPIPSVFRQTLRALYAHRGKEDVCGHCVRYTDLLDTPDEFSCL